MHKKVAPSDQELLTFPIYNSDDNIPNSMSPKVDSIVDKSIIVKYFHTVEYQDRLLKLTLFPSNKVHDVCPGSYYLITPAILIPDPGENSGINSSYAF